LVDTISGECGATAAGPANACLNNSAQNNLA
jgi:hypothetical protein